MTNFLLVDTSIKEILEIFFLFSSNANIDFKAKEFIWKKYSTIETLLIINWMQLIDKQKFIKEILDKNLETFVIYVIVLISLTEMLVHPS